MSIYTFFLRQVYHKCKVNDIKTVKDLNSYDNPDIIVCSLCFTCKNQKKQPAANKKAVDIDINSRKVLANFMLQRYRPQ